ncbi:MAG: putative toxin-antitoxin system toxin component, PIN family, partial [Acidobacteria bacterium]|nr:putative toxin-antitoxin system toxin component, PIN family [Acidobacteriota bacterium]
MIRVVFDTNVVVSAALKPQGLESKVLELVADQRVTLWVSPAILAEYQEVMLRPKLPLEPARAKKLLSQLRAAASVVQPAEMLSISSDEANNRFLECAEEAQADFLVTGNKRHFPKRWKGTQVVNSR